MHMIVGLGNPGSRYAKSRHNVGFMAVDLLAKHWQVPIKRSEGKALTGCTTYQGQRVLLVKPQTFMNESGQAVSLLADYYKIALPQILVIYDDLDLPVGRLRLRAKGSAGGHNGMRSVIKYLGTDIFPRLRIGIGSVPDNMQGMNYVLSQFSAEEASVIANACSSAVDAVQSWLLMGLAKTMSQINAV